MTTEKLVYTASEVSAKLQISKNLVYKLGRARKLPGSIHLGVRRMIFSAAAIDRLIAGDPEKPGESRSER